MKMRLNNLKKKKIKEELKEIKSLNWFDENKLDESKFQLLLTVTNLVTKKKKKKKKEKKKKKKKKKKTHQKK